MLLPSGGVWGIGAEGAPVHLRSELCKLRLTERLCTCIVHSLSAASVDGGSGASSGVMAEWCMTLAVLGQYKPSATVVCANAPFLQALLAQLWSHRAVVQEAALRALNAVTLDDADALLVAVNMRVPDGTATHKTKGAKRQRDVIVQLELLIRKVQL